MPIIQTIIQPQRFELIRDRIAAILADEIANQFALSGSTQDAAKINPRVWTERTVPFDKSEHPAVNVQLDAGAYDNGDTRSVRGIYQYNIDVYTHAKYGPDGLRGDQRAMLRSQRIVGLIRAILMHSEYRNLLFPSPFIGYIRVTGFRVLQVTEEQDSLSSVRARIEIEVQTSEWNGLGDTNPLVSTLTHVLLYDTPKGYYYESILAINTVFTGTKNEGPPLDVAGILAGEDQPYSPGSDIAVAIGPDTPSIKWAAWPLQETGIVGYYIDDLNYEYFGINSLWSTPVVVGGFWFTQYNYPSGAMVGTFKHSLEPEIL